MMPFLYLKTDHNVCTLKIQKTHFSSLVREIMKYVVSFFNKQRQVRGLETKLTVLKVLKIDVPPAAKKQNYRARLYTALPLLIT